MYWEHEVAGEYFLEIQEKCLGVPHNVSNRSLFYCISFKNDNRKFNADANWKI